MIVQQQECLEMLKFSCSTQSSPDHKQKEIIGIRYKKKAFMLINWTIFNYYLRYLFLLFNHKILVINDTLSDFNLI